MSATVHPISPLRDFVISMTHLVNETQDEPTLVNKGSALLKQLIADDSWLPTFCTIHHHEYYQQFLLHTDPLERFSVVSFV
jgi:predicted metal-dependent enzyme (double-stranded beta helix superfamily)